MKILRNLVVTGELLQAESGDVAAVGDLIVLYLDQTYNPEFPESINGTIDGINKVNCESDTSYSIEYDETQLEGSVTYLRPEDVTDYLVLNQVGVVAVDLEAEAAARAAADALLAAAKADADPLAITEILQGAEGDPEKIGEEYLPDQIEVNALTLVDSTGVSFPDRTVSGGIDPKYIYLYNTGDAFPYAPLPRNTLRKIMVLPNTVISREVVNFAGRSTITASGNLSVTVTCATVVGSPLVVAVPVVVGDTELEWMPKIIATLAATAAVSAQLTPRAVGGFGQLQAVYTGTDATLAISITTGTATGFTTVNGSKTSQFARVEIGRFQLQPSESIVGKRFDMFGRVDISFNNIVANAALMLGVSRTTTTLATAPTTYPLNRNASATAYQSKMFFTAPLQLIAQSGGIGLTGTPANTVTTTAVREAVFSSAGALEADLPRTPTGSTANSYSTIGVTTDLSLWAFLPIDQTAAGTVIINADLNLSDGSW